MTDAPPVASTEIVPLQPPEPVAPVEDTTATRLVQVDPGTAKELDDKAAAFVQSLGGLDIHSSELPAKFQAIQDLGAQDIKASAAVSNRLLTSPPAPWRRGSSTSPPACPGPWWSCAARWRTSTPRKQGDLFPRRAPRHHPVRRQAARLLRQYQSARATSTRSSTRSTPGRTSCARTTPPSSRRRRTSGTSMRRLRQYVYIGQQLDAALAAA